jgi:L-ascorbate metabolism protein UlaG (beta-lactamase superfamily)
MSLLSTFLVSCTGAPHYRGANSDHFNGSQFVNRVPMAKGAGDLLRLGWGAATESEQWPDWVEIEPGSIAEQRVYDGIAVTYINHATFLIQVGGVNILTDPIYSKRASPFQWTGPARVHQPGLDFEQLPPIDVILVSHNHYDHLDEATLRRFAAMDDQPLVLSGLGNGRLFEQLGLRRYRDLDWEEGYELGGLEFVFAECRHRSGRGVTDQMKTLWGSFVIETPAGNIYFAGDTGYGPHFRDTGERHGPFALALLPIGAYEPRWFMKDVHLNPAEAVQAHQDLGAEFSIGMHFGTFQLTYEAIEQPVIDLERALLAAGVSAAAFVTLPPGGSTTLGVSQNVSPDRTIATAR